MSNRITSAATRIGFTPEAGELPPLPKLAKLRLAVEPTFTARRKSPRYDDALRQFLAPPSVEAGLLETGDALEAFDQLIELLASKPKSQDLEDAIEALGDVRAEWGLLDVYQRSLLRA